MKNVYAHSAKSPANWLVNLFTDWNRPRTSAFKNGIRGLLLCVVLIFVAIGSAQAQNNSANPYINSWHKYNVPMGNTGNTIVWQIQKGAGAPISLTEGLMQGSDVWVHVGKEPAGTPTHAYIEIKFLDYYFDNGETWTLIYSEMNGSTCLAKRSFDITILDNDFKVSLAADGSACNSFVDNVWDNTDDLTADADGTIDFTVNMEKNPTHLVRTWTFQGMVTFSSGYQVRNPLISTTTGTTPHGSWEITAQSVNTFTLVVTVNNPTTDSYASDAVPIKININGPPIADVDVTLTISNAVARSGTNYTVVTDDTGTADDHNQTLTLWGIPNTSIITVSAN